MEELLAIVLGAVAVVVSPLIPAVRPVAKNAVKGGLALGAAATGVAAMAVAQADHLREGISSTLKHSSDPVKVDDVATASATVSAAAATVEPVAETVAPAATPKATATAPAPAAIVGDDLTQISGIGPKAAAALADAGITTFAQLAATSEADLRGILLSANARFRIIDPSSWPSQAANLAADSTK